MHALQEHRMLPVALCSFVHHSIHEALALLEQIAPQSFEKGSCDSSQQHDGRRLVLITACQQTQMSVELTFKSEPLQEVTASEDREPLRPGSMRLTRMMPSATATAVEAA